MKDYKQLTNRLQNLFKEYLVDEDVKTTSLALILDDKEEFLEKYKEGIAKWKFTTEKPQSEDEIFVTDIGLFKGLESDMVIYIHKDNISSNLNYIAYTRAKYYLIELIMK